MNSKVVTAMVSALALLAVTTHATAQSGDGGKDSAGQARTPKDTSKSAPSGKGDGGGPSNAERGGNAGGSATEGRQGRTHGKSAEQQDGKAGSKADSRSDSNIQPRSSPQRSESKASSSEGRRGQGDGGRKEGKQVRDAGEAKGNKDRSGAAQPVDKDASKSRAADSEKSDRRGQSGGRDPGSAAKGAAENGGRRDGQGATGASQGMEGKADAAEKRDSAGKGGDSAAGRSGTSQPTLSQITPEKKDIVRQRIVRAQPRRITDRNVNIVVGERLPRQFRLLAIPATVLSEAPAYRSYRYAVINDEICIVDPTSYEIVEVIAYAGDGGGSGQRGARGSDRTRVAIALSSDQRNMVYEEIAASQPPMQLDTGVSIGTELPSSATLTAFPRQVVEHVPELERFRFLYTGDRVVVVNPSDREVVLLISK